MNDRNKTPSTEKRGEEPMVAGDHPRAPGDRRDEIELFLRDAYAAGCSAAQSRSLVTAMEYAEREAPKLRARLAPAKPERPVTTSTANYGRPRKLRHASEQAGICKAFPPEAKSPVYRSRAALPANIRKTLEESNLPVEVATAIADLCDGLIRPEARAIEALQTVREMIRGQQIEHQVVNFDHPAIGLGQWLDSFLPQRKEDQHG